MQEMEHGYETYPWDRYDPGPVGWTLRGGQPAANARVLQLLTQHPVVRTLSVKGASESEAADIGKQLAEYAALQGLALAGTTPAAACGVLRHAVGMANVTRLNLHGCTSARNRVDVPWQTLAEQRALAPLLPQLPKLAELVFYGETPGFHAGMTATDDTMETIGGSLAKLSALTCLRIIHVHSTRYSAAGGRGGRGGLPLLHYIAKLPALRTLHVYDVNMEKPAHVRALTAPLAAMTRLTHLAAELICLTPEAPAVVHAIAALPQLTAFQTHLLGHSMTECWPDEDNEMCRALGKLLSSNETLTRLDVSWNLQADLGRLRLVLPARSATLRHVSVRGSPILEPPQASNILACMHKLPHVTCLDLAEHAVPHAQLCKLFGAPLRAHAAAGALTNLQALYLSGRARDTDRNTMWVPDGNPAAAPLGDSLGGLRSLTLLDLGRTSLGCDAAAAIVQSLAALPKFAAIFLDRNSLHLGSAAALAEAMLSAHKLRSVVLSRNAFSADKVVQMGAYLKQMTQLTALHLRSCDLRRADGVAATLGSLRSLRYLDLRNNGFDEAGILALRAAVTALTALTRVRLSPQQAAPWLD